MIRWLRHHMVLAVYVVVVGLGVVVYGWLML